MGALSQGKKGENIQLYEKESQEESDKKSIRNLFNSLPDFGYFVAAGNNKPKERGKKEKPQQQQQQKENRTIIPHLKFNRKIT